MTTAAAAAPAPAMAATPLSHHRQTRLAAAYPASAAASPWHRPGRAYLNLSAAAIRSPATSRHRHSPARAAAPSAPTPSASTYHGPCYVVGNNIDTDQIIPAQYLTLVPSKPDEYRKLGSYALIGLPSAAYPVPFVEHGHETTRFPIIVAGANFGCGSSREHAPVALGAAGVRAVVAESYARIFFRNSVATGEVYPVESEGVGLCKECSTGDIVTVDIAENALINHTTGKQYRLKPIGDAGPVVAAGGIFAYARQTGMIPSAESD